MSQVGNPSSSSMQDRMAPGNELAEERQRLASQIKHLQSQLVALEQHARQQQVSQEEERRFQQYVEEAEWVAEHVDDWMRSPGWESKSGPSVLFLGCLSGEWLSRSKCRGHSILPSAGGFLVSSQDTQILIDPGPSTMQGLLDQGINPTRLRAVLVTDPRFDSTADLHLVIMAASGTAENRNKRLRLWAAPSVLHGVPLLEDELQCLISKGNLSGATQRRLFSSPERPALAGLPPVTAAYDLLVRLGGRYESLLPGQVLCIAEDVTLFTFKTRLAVDFRPDGYNTIEGAGLDIRLAQADGPELRCVYLPEILLTEDLIEQLTTGVPIDLLICNVGALPPQSQNRAAYVRYARSQLGWTGASTLVRGLRENGTLRDTSLIVLRRWGMETVTRVDGTDGQLVAAPEKLAVYEARFRTQSGHNTVIPGKTLISFPNAKSGGGWSIEHIHRPFIQGHGAGGLASIFCNSRVMRELLLESRAVLDKNRWPAVLITGESGTGKDALAKAIHEEAVREKLRDDTLMSEQVNALNPELAWAVLAGVEKGSHSQASQATIGWFGAAGCGTLVLQEAGDMPPEIQVQFLKVLQDGAYTRCGGVQALRLKAQVIMTTEHNLEELIKAGKFRNSLRQRCRELIIPPLRDRPEDIDALVAAWQQQGLLSVHLDLECVAILKEYRWPGNVRQLEHAMRRLSDNENSCHRNLSIKERVRLVANEVHRLTGT